MTVRYYLAKFRDKTTKSYSKLQEYVGEAFI